MCVFPERQPAAHGDAREEETQTAGLRRQSFLYHCAVDCMRARSKTRLTWRTVTEGAFNAS